MSRRVATDADLKVGTIVYKGNGQVAYKVWQVRTRNDGGTSYGLQKLTSVSAPASRLYRAADLQIEAPEPTGIETLRDLLSFD